VKTKCIPIDFTNELIIYTTIAEGLKGLDIAVLGEFCLSCLTFVVYATHTISALVSPIIIKLKFRT